jgi:hypothetical protein
MGSRRTVDSVPVTYRNTVQADGFGLLDHLLRMRCPSQE